MRQAIGLTLALAVVSAASPTGARAASQTFQTAVPLAKGEFVLREQLFYTRAGDDPAATNRESEAWGSISVLGYGATSDLTLFGVVPFVDKSLDVTTPRGARVERDTHGLGDARLFARYTVYQDDAPGRTFRIAPFAGVELPTGRDDDRDRFGRLPQPLQAGSGSWDIFGGAVASWQTLDYGIDVQLAYKSNTEANDFEFGDVARADASVQSRLLPREIGPGVPWFLNATLGANLIHRGGNEVAGMPDPASGGTQFFLSPGLQYVTKRWVLEGVVQLPLAQDLNAAGLEDDFIARAGFRMNF